MAAALRVDEETPLLNEDRDRAAPQSKKTTDIPWNQFSIVLFLQLAEPLTSQVIYPFSPQLIRDVGITHGDEARVGYYVGLMQSIFFATQAVTVMQWSRMSDYLGRKPVILTGLFGLSLSMYCFGLSRTFWSLVVSRSLNGALNGNIGVIKSMMAELMSGGDLAQAYAYMPIAWSTGGTLGPIIGGMLSRPADRFPSVFGDSEFHKTYPYFLACSVPATFTVCAWLVTFFFLKETVRNPISLSSLLTSRTSKGTLALPPTDPAASDLPNPKPTPTRSSSSTDITLSASTSSLPPKTFREPAPAADAQPLPFRRLLTYPVLVSAANYAALSLVDIAFRALQPVFFSTPVALGGLGLPPHHIGGILSVFGVLNGIFQVLWFARIHKAWGSKRTYLVGIGSTIPAFALFPVINFLAIEGMQWALWIAVLAQIMVSVLISLSYGAVFIYISGSAPNRASLGATNGLCQMTVSVMRAIGPAAANSLFALSIDPNSRITGGSWIVYGVLEALACAALLVGTMLPREVWPMPLV